MRKRLIFFSAVLLCLFFVVPTFAQTPQEVIKDISSQITVNQDGSMKVTETIVADGRGDQIKHGIYRDFPTKYKDKLGNNYNVGFKLLSVKRDGEQEDSHFGELSNGLRVYIGNKDKFLTPGIHIFEISYETDHQLGFFDDHDELYWNVTGNGWVFPIERASAVITLPANIPAEKLMLDGYTGSQGSVEKNFTHSVNSNQATFTTTQKLGAYEGLTIVVGWPKRFVAEPTQADKTKRLLNENIGIFFVLGGFLLTLLYFLIIWYRKGRDPKKGTIIPIYEAPEGLSPAAVGYIYRMGYVDRQFVAAIINMAVKGFIRIENVKKKYHLIKIGNESALSSDELELSQELFGKAKEVVLENSNFKAISVAKSKLSGNLWSNYSEKYFSSNLKLFIIGCIIAGLAFVVSVGFYSILAPVFILVYLFICIIFYKLFKQPTAYGRQYMDQIEGFKWFLSVTEKDRMNFHNPPEKTPELFEKFLPYALALGVDNKWAKQFADVFARLQEQGRGYMPVWYLGANFSAMNFVNSFGKSFSNAVVAASHPPGSSSGFGGFSGGGGGGGGGGGW